MGLCSGSASRSARPIEVDLDPTLRMLFADGREIETVLSNLIENAAKCSADGSPIGVAAVRRGGQAVLSVTDQGIGIPPEQRGRIFERFYQVPAANRRPPGTGLGLAICKQIVEAYGGRIWVEGGPGLGSCFYVSLPLEGPGAPGAATA